LAVLRITMSTYVHDTTHTKACGFFLSEGVRCGTTLRRPAGASATDRLPVVLMIHGWGGVQASLIPPFYEAFLRQGLAVMTFDFRGWGASDGWPRQVIRVKDRLADVEAALAHLKTCPGIDDRRIVLWGTSLGGGHAITVGSHHPELLGIVAQVPMLDGRAAAMITPWRRKLRFAAWALADWLKPGKQPIYVPTVSAPGVFGTMDRDDAYGARQRGIELYGVNVDNKIAARSLLTMGGYRPIKDLHRVRVPTLLLGGLKDTVAPFDASAVEAVGNACVRTVGLAVNHFEPYFEPGRRANLAHQLDFLTALLAAH
jgi:alpha-beta hydrolase superfamily lysophospholipase